MSLTKPAKVDMTVVWVQRNQNCNQNNTCHGFGTENEVESVTGLSQSPILRFCREVHVPCAELKTMLWHLAMAAAYNITSI